MSKSRRTPFRSRAFSLERLEDRQMMAGDVTATLSGGSLYLKEAAGQAGLENSVVISQLPSGQIRVTGNDTVSNDGTKSLINGHTSQDFSVPGSLFVNFGGGSDRVIFDADPSRTPHFNEVHIDVAAPPIVVSPHVATGLTNTILNSPDADQVFLWNAVTSGSMFINTGRDHDWVTLGNDITGNVSIGKDLVITTGSGQDTVNLLTNQGNGVKGNIDIQTYDSLSETDPDTVWLGNAIASGDIRVRTGGGNDLVHLNDSTAFKNISINTGAGDDRTELIRVMAVDQLMADLGDGNDGLSIDTLYFNNDANVILTGGNGTDMLKVVNVDPSNFSHFNKSGWEWINGRIQPIATVGNKLAAAKVK